MAACKQPTSASLNTQDIQMPALMAVLLRWTEVRLTPATFAITRPV